MTETYTKSARVTISHRYEGPYQDIVRTTTLNKGTDEAVSVVWEEEIERDIDYVNDLINKSAQELFPDFTVTNLSLNTSYCECCGEDTTIEATLRRKATTKQITAAKKILAKR